MAATKEDILSALAKLSSSDDTHWTDDGLPRVDVMQKFTEDPTLTRRKISEAAPGFSRAGSEANQEPEDVQPGDPETVVQPAGAEGEDPDPSDPLADPLDEDEVRAIMAARVDKASDRLDQAREALREATENVKRCERFLDKAKLEMHKRFPPLHPSDAIKAHLQTQLQQRYEAAGLGHIGPASQIDAAMGIRGKQGYRRPNFNAA